MKASELAQKLGWRPACGDGENEVTGCYCGDLLSWVMAKAPAGSVWLTVMGNVNCVAVASLRDLACVVITEGAPLDEAALVRAAQQGVTIYTTDRSTYDCAVAVSGMIE